MDNTRLAELNAVNRAIISFRGTYSAWAKRNGISYNEQLVLYTIREYGYCTQKTICDNYLLPKQTVNNVISSLVKRGLMEVDRDHGKGRCKAFSLTAEGERWASTLLSSLDELENRAIDILGEARFGELTELMCAYNSALESAMQEVE